MNGKAKFTLILSMVLFPLFGFKDGLTGESKDPQELVALLSNPDGETRAAAAAELRQLIAANPDSKTNDHGEEYWKKRVDSVKVGMKHAEVLKILPPVDQNIPVKGEGQEHVMTWRPDDYWTVTVFYLNPDAVKERPRLHREALRVWVQPPADFTGTWVTWHVNGQKSYESEYRNGFLNGLSLIFYDNGSKLHQQYYIESIPSDTAFFWYPDGRKKSQGDYTNRKRTGTWIFWNEDGSVDTIEYLVPVGKPAETTRSPN